jgi:integrating conjugative element protein (TIGR03765 family)
MIGVIRTLQSAALLLALASPVAARAAALVIYDSGQTQPLAPYYESLRGEDPAPETRRVPSGKPGLTVEDLLPIKTPEMTPGPLTARALNLPGALSGRVVGARPLFLIGADALSQRWLAQHRARLKEISAVGLLVATETIEDLETIARIAEGLPIMPAPGSEIAKLYALKHYPVLIWQGRIEQ